MINRPILIILLGYILGIIIGLYCKISIAIFIIIIVISHFIYNHICKNSVLRNREIRHYIYIFNIKKVIVIFFISMIVSNTIVLILNNKYNSIFKNIKEAKFIATIMEEPKIKQYSVRYKIKIENIDEDIIKYKNVHLYLNTKRDNLKVGDKVKFTGKFVEPEIQRNYGGFNYKEYLKSIGIYGSVNASQVEIIGTGKIAKIKLIVVKVANHIKEVIKQNIENENNRNLLLGILLGNDEDIENQIKESFRESSLSHLLAVSGMHASYVILGVSILLSKLKFSKKVIKICTIILLIFFIFLTGETPSVKRACIMAIMSIIATLIYRKSDIVTNLSISLLIILIQNPFSIMNLGLILSFSATIGIVVFYKNILYIFSKKEDQQCENIKAQKHNKKKILKKFYNKIKEIVSVSISVQIFIFPLTILIFNKISLTFIISNILVSFIIGIIIILGFLSIIFRFKICFFILEICLKLLTSIADIFSEISISNIIVATPNLIFVISYYILLILIYYIIFLRKKHFKRVLEIKFLTFVDKFKLVFFNHKTNILISIILIVILIQSIKFIPQNLKIHFIDVGQGDSCLIITPKNKTILIDGGGTKSSTYDVREKYTTTIFVR
ncbi:MAG: DUF4131 domain-containing protein [Clostridia bacterium]|nr:DUF4131 domain-containing protein [Clostridia bacterium]